MNFDAAQWEPLADAVGATVVAAPVCPRFADDRVDGSSGPPAAALGGPSPTTDPAPVR
ncbi:hypothetical protein [Nocardia sp. alder85J]|uniref:hypothetical protein n=1 Tax=Nocardia sp. alder85J TaxID=2862949 RepID=UPI001CD6066A|nr:hypothetical protein [Nocardia sp. alder85J]MCX4092951.1 hypothetical protein [Nocardia sp. alder85J]